MLSTSTHSGIHAKLQVTYACLYAFHPWRDTALLPQREPLRNIPSRRMVVTTDVSLTGCGVGGEGRMVRSVWMRACPDNNREFLHGVSHKSTGRHQVPTLPPSGTETPLLGLSTSGISHGSLHSKGCGSGRRPLFQDWFSPRRLKAPFRSGSCWMDSVQQCSD